MATGRVRSLRRAVTVIALACVAVLAAGCATTRPVRFASIVNDDVDDLEPASLALAADRSAEALERLERERHHEIGTLEITSRELAKSARHVAEAARDSKTAAELTQRLARACRAWPASEAAKITGYYEPVLAARRKPDARFRHPLYSPPSAQQKQALREKLGRTPARADIDGANVLAGLGLEIAWLDDPVARFFLHVQGSGRLRFEDGRESRVGFAATNGLPYRSVGAIMLERGMLEPGDATATAMQRWLREHPAERDALLGENPRYVFFRDDGATEGPVGSLGVPLVAGRSIAVDTTHVPPGMLAWLRSRSPVVDAKGRAIGYERMTRLAFAQDTGAAIQGAARVDLFFGSGEEAGFEAGAMNESGELYLLLCGSRPPAGPILGPYGAPFGGGGGVRP